MKRLVAVVFATLISSFWLSAQDPSPALAQRSADPSRSQRILHGAFPVKVLKTLDSSKLKDGDPVEVETAGKFKLKDGTLVHRGTKVTGRVTVAKARSKGDPDSQLTLVFDRLNVTKEKELSMTGILQAVFPPDDADPNMTAGAYAAAGGAVSGASVGTVSDAQIGSNLEHSSTKAQPVMTPDSVGVQGIDGLELNRGVLSSKGKNVKLGPGVRIMVRAAILE
jgi:hypothetical protein